MNTLFIEITDDTNDAGNPKIAVCIVNKHIDLSTLKEVFGKKVGKKFDKCQRDLLDILFKEQLPLPLFLLGITANSDGSTLCVLSVSPRENDRYRKIPAYTVIIPKDSEEGSATQQTIYDKVARWCRQHEYSIS